MSEHLERDERLVEFFKSNPAIWDDITEEINVCIKNAQNQVKLKDCQYREYWAGYWEALEFVKELDRKFKWQKPEV